MRDIEKIRKNYHESKQFKYDIISIIPIDYVLGEHCKISTSGAAALSTISGWPWPVSWFRPFPVVRLNRLLRIDRVRDCMERTETR